MGNTCAVMWISYILMYKPNRRGYGSSSGSMIKMSRLYQVRRTCLPWEQGSWGQHGAHLGPTGPRLAPSWPHELCYLGYLVPNLPHTVLTVFPHPTCFHFSDFPVPRDTLSTTDTRPCLPRTYYNFEQFLNNLDVKPEWRNHFCDWCLQRCPPSSW